MFKKDKNKEIENLNENLKKINQKLSEKEN